MKRNQTEQGTNVNSSTYYFSLWIYLILVDFSFLIGKKGAHNSNLIGSLCDQGKVVQEVGSTHIYLVNSKL